MKNNTAPKRLKTTSNAKSKCSAILVIETKEERIRTIKEYEKERSIIRSMFVR